jgi:hypothetical protein
LGGGGNAMLPPSLGDGGAILGRSLASGLNQPVLEQRTNTSGLRNPPIGGEGGVQVTPVAQPQEAFEGTRVVTSDVPKSNDANPILRVVQRIGVESNPTPVPHGNGQGGGEEMAGLNEGGDGDFSTEVDGGNASPRYPSRVPKAPERFAFDPRFYPRALAVLDVNKYDVPNTYEEAMANAQVMRWREALDEEYNSLLENDTWELVDREPGMKVIPSKWVFKIKEDAQGNPVRFKCRLVAGGHRQVHGIDFDEVFAPVSKHTTMRCFLSIASHNAWKVFQMDIKTAFLHGEIDVEVFMKQPSGYEVGDKVCKLTKCLYGLKQAPRAWHAKLTNHLREIGFSPSMADPSFWVKREGNPVYLIMVVDDILITSSDEANTRKSIDRILGKFPGNVGDANYYIGIKLTWGEKCVTLTQETKIRELVAKYGQENATPLSLPMAPGVKLVKEGDVLNGESHARYQSLVGALLYLSITTRPDISQTVSKLAKYMAYPTQEHWKHAIYLLRYLHGTASLGLRLGHGETLEAYCDSDYASDLDKRRSTTGYCYILYGGAISWQSKHQRTIALSTTEAEYQSASGAAKEGLWLRYLLPEYGIECTPLIIKSDSQGAIASLKNPMFSQRTKHIDVIHHFVREKVADGILNFEFCPGAENVADVLTKPLPGPKFRFCCMGLGLIEGDKRT